MRHRDIPWICILLAGLFVALLTPAPGASAEPIKLKMTKGGGEDVDLLWQGSSPLDYSVARSRYKTLDYKRTLAKTPDQSFRDTYVLLTPELYFYSVNEFDCSEPTQSLIRGRVFCSETSKPKTDCEVEIIVRGCPEVDPVTYTVTTDSNGLYEVCIECPGCEQWDIRVQACCGAVKEMNILDCPAAISVPNMYCECDNGGPCGDPEQTLVRGRVVCGDLEEPVAGCAVELEVRGCPNVPPVTYSVVTDADGWYEICVDCPGCEEWIIVARAGCCDAVEDPRVLGCPGEFAMPTLRCNNCSEDRPCEEPEHTKITGRVICDATEEPMAECAVDVIVKCENNTKVYEAVTDAQGYYTLCVACPECVVWTVVVETRCCSGRAERQVERCPPEAEMPLIRCTGCEPEERPCGPERTQITGRVLCDATGEPMAQCVVDVVVKCGNDSTSYEAVTDADGYYKVCVNCPGCEFWSVVVETRCCEGRAERIEIEGCPLEVEMPLIRCAGCEPEERPCGPEKTEIRGRVICGDLRLPVSGCEVTIEVRCGEDSWTYTAVTNGDGVYEVCVDCPACDVWSLVVSAGCCSDITDPPVEGCPPRFEVRDLHCDTC